MGQNRAMERVIRRRGELANSNKSNDNIITIMIIIRRAMGPSACQISVRALGRVVVVSRPRKVGAPGPTAAKVGGKPSPWIPINLPQGHGDCICAMDSFDAFRIHP